jgi:general secretion pathway protein D
MWRSQRAQDSNTNIQADEATNAIVITAPAAITLSVKKVINKLDVERAQVLIEAVIAEITSSDTNELGIQWLGAGGDGIGLIDFNGQIPALLGNMSDPSKFANSLKAGASYLVGNHSKDASVKITNALGLVINALNSMRSKRLTISLIRLTLAVLSVIIILLEGW